MNILKNGSWSMLLMREKPFDPSDTELLRALHSHNFKNRWSQYGPICFCMSILHSDGSCRQQKKLCPAMPTFRQYWDVISSLMVCRSPAFPYKAYHKRPEHLQAEDLRSHGFHLSDKSFLQTYFSRKHHEIRYHH